MNSVKVVAKKSKRLLIVNIISLVLMVVVAVLLGVLVENKNFLILPAFIMVINVYMMVDYAKTPLDMIVVEGEDIVIKGSFGNEERVKIANIRSIIGTKYSSKRTDGILGLDIKGRKKPLLVQAVLDVENTRALIFEECKAYGFRNAYDIPNAENTDTSIRDSADVEVENISDNIPSEDRCDEADMVTDDREDEDITF